VYVLTFPDRRSATTREKLQSNHCFTAAIPPQTQEGEHHEVQTHPPPRITALLIGLALAGSASVACAAPTVSSNSWFHYVTQVVECALGDHDACAAIKNDGLGTITTDASDGKPRIHTQ
jgi:hypothetical protein